VDLSSAICFTAVKKIRRLTAEHAESAENPKVLFSAVFAVSAVIVGFSTHFQRLSRPSATRPAPGVQRGQLERWPSREDRRENSRYTALNFAKSSKLVM